MKAIRPAPLEPLLAKGQIRSYPEGQIVLYQGEAPNDVFFLETGAVKVIDIDADGNEKILTILRAPAFFPLLFHLGKQDDIPFFYTTLTESKICVVNGNDFQQILHANNEVALYALRKAYTEIHELRVRIASLSKTDTSTKLLSALKFLAKYHTKVRASTWQRVMFPVSHQFLADMVGVTRESTTIGIGKLQEEKLIRFPKRGIMEINTFRLSKR